MSPIPGPSGYVLVPLGGSVDFTLYRGRKHDPARGNRVQSATYTDLAGSLPALSPTPQCCRCSSCARPPSAGTSVSIASVSLCSPFPAKCAHRNRLNSRVHSRMPGTTQDCSVEFSHSTFGSNGSSHDVKGMPRQTFHQCCDSGDDHRLLHLIPTIWFTSCCWNFSSGLIIRPGFPALHRGKM